MANILNVVIAADNNYIPYASICIQSLFATNPDFDRIDVHLLGNELTDISIKKFTSMFDGERYQYSLHSISDIKDRLQTSVPDTIAITSYARLFICSILPPEIDKVLYIDCDVIFNGSILDFYNSDIGDNLVGGVLDTFMNTRAKDLIGIARNEPYINAGVLLIPLDKWRKCNIEKQFVEFLLKHNGNVYHHDQGIINAVCQGKKYLFPPQYNASSFYFSHPYRILKQHNTPFYSQREVDYAIKNPILIHYTCGYLNRPWIENCKHPYVSLFHKYRNLSNYTDIPLLKDKRSNREKLDSYVFLNFPYSLFRIYSRVVEFIGRIKNVLKQ